MKKFLEWTHPAVPFHGLKMYKGYDLEYLKELFTMDQIRIFFKPIDFEWEELEEDNVVNDTMINVVKYDD